MLLSLKGAENGKLFGKFVLVEWLSVDAVLPDFLSQKSSNFFKSYIFVVFFVVTDSKRSTLELPPSHSVVSDGLRCSELLAKARFHP